MVFVASEPKNVFQLNGPQALLLKSAEPAPRKLNNAALNWKYGPSIAPYFILSDADADFGLRRRRVPRGSSDGRTEQHSQRDHRLYETNDYLTTPKPVQRSAATILLDTSSISTSGPVIKTNSTPKKGTAGIYNPLYPVMDGSYSAYAVMLLSLIVFAVGITGNLAVMCIVCHNYYMKSAWNSILASLAFWDFLVLFFCLPVVVFNEITKKMLLGDISCRIVPFLEVTSLGVTTFSLCALGIDRFHAATSLQPTTQEVEKCQSILAKLAVIWIGSMILALPELLLWQLSQDASGTGGGVVDSCSMQPSLSLPESIYALVHTYHDARMWWYFGCYFCLPLLFTLSCQLVTQRIGGADGARLEPCPPPSSSSSSSSSSSYSTCSSPKKLQERRRQRKRDRQLGYTVAALATVYAVCGLPENVCNIALAYTSIQVSAPTQALLTLINQFFLFFRSSVTPVVLLCLCKSLGQSFIDCCCCCCEECLSDGASSTCAASTTSSTPSSICKPKPVATEIPPSVLYRAKDGSSVLAIGTPC
ncbi:hypothetical protein GJAV_G00178750 [Gymnothorax javanicus]|nr:hypothetical protein GJAV_G00178750 [Gymnothorax javanicus]